MRKIGHFKLMKKQLSVNHTALTLVSTCLYALADSCNTNIAG